MASLSPPGSNEPSTPPRDGGGPSLWARGLRGVVSAFSNAAWGQSDEAAACDTNKDDEINDNDSNQGDPVVVNNLCLGMCVWYIFVDVALT